MVDMSIDNYNISMSQLPQSYYLVDMSIDNYNISMSQLPQSYYFTTRILVLKFMNKGVFLRKSRIHIFLEKEGILVLTSVNLDKKGVILMSSVLLWKWVHLGWKVGVYRKKVFCHKKGHHFQTGEQGWVPLFPVSEGAGKYVIVLFA